MIESAKSAATTKGDGSNELMNTDAVASVATHESRPAQFADDHGGASGESDGKAASSSVPVSGAAESVAADNFHKHLDNCYRCRNRPFDLCPVGAFLLEAAASVVIKPNERQA